MQISGLGSNIDTAGMVDQLMSAERLAGKPLTQGKLTSQSLVTAFTSLNGKMKAIGDAAHAFVPKSVLDTPAWNTVAAKSSNSDIATVTTGDKAQAGTLTFTVKQLAQAGTVMSGTGFGGTDVVNAANGGAAFDFNVGVGDKTTNIKVGPNAKLADVAAAINQQAGGDVKASMVQVASGTYKLQIQAVSSGAKSDVNVTNGSTPPVVADVLGSFSQVAKGQDTLIHVGDANAGYDVTSSTKEVKDLLPGVTISPLKADPNTQVTVDISTDGGKIADKVEAMIKAANDALGTIKTNSTYNKDTPSASGPLVGDSTSRDLSNNIRNSIMGSVGLDPSQAGISIDKDGTLTFDKAKFTTNYGKDSASVQKVVNDVATKLGQVADNATDPNTGSITARINGEQANIKDYSDRITQFNDRMTLRQQALSAQFNAMETMLSNLKSQGSWMSSQISALG